MLFVISENIKDGKVFVDDKVIVGGSININSVFFLVFKYFINIVN